MFTNNIDVDWRAQLANEFEEDYMRNLASFLQDRKAAGASIYPPEDQIFNAFASTSFEDVKVVILGQDPYHGQGQAHGLSFSVGRGVPIPPSLRNLFTELTTDLGIDRPSNGDLHQWASRGVLLLNACLTVEDGTAGAHQGKGWELFTDAVIAQLNTNRTNLVFILWGRKAQEKGITIDKKRHLVIESPHPSPLSAYAGFFGTKPFSRTNNYLTEHGIDPIDWQL